VPTYVEDIDVIFKALADPTRRRVIERLAVGPATTSELAEPFSMAMPSFLQHMTLLDQAGLTTSTKHGRTRTYHLSPIGLGTARSWLADQRRVWVARLDQLDQFLLNQQEQQ
jgi:DNA-binding transcriptional ArsR family regulator